MKKIKLPHVQIHKHKNLESFAEIITHIKIPELPKDIIQILPTVKYKI